MKDQLKGKTIVVTGGAGAIGSNLVRELDVLGCTIIVVDDLSSGYLDILPQSQNITFIQGSITEDEILKKVFSHDIDYVFHLAALFANQNSIEHPEQDLKVNALGTLKLLTYAKDCNVKKFIYTSSSCVYGDKVGAVSEDRTDFHLHTPYAVSKLMGEKYVMFFNEYYGLKTVILRLFNSFGPGEKPGVYRNVVPNFFRKAINKEPLTIYGTGNETRDFNWVGNVVQLLMKSAYNDSANAQIFNVGSGKETTILEMAKLINKITNNPAEVVFQPGRVWDGIKSRCADIEKAKKLLDYSPDASSLEEQLTKTYEWIKKHA